MLDDLLILHHPTKPEEKPPVTINELEWQTCLRRILLLHKGDRAALIPSLPNDSETYEGKDAYRFLLEVICGLRSPMVGETAVMGQFKEFCSQVEFPKSEWGRFLRQCTSDLLSDAKRVRHAHLQGLGSQSYGGMVRQHLKGTSSVIVLGAGQLAEEILPWIVGKADVTVSCRTPARASRLPEQYPHIRLEQFSITKARHEDRHSAVIIAAPLRAAEIETWMAFQHTPFVKILDLRGEADTDPVTATIPVIRLAELFAAVKSDRGKMAVHLSAAKSEIQKAAERLTASAQFRPFGWEDLCA